MRSRQLTPKLHAGRRELLRPPKSIAVLYYGSLLAARPQERTRRAQFGNMSVLPMERDGFKAFVDSASVRTDRNRVAARCFLAIFVRDIVCVEGNPCRSAMGDSGDPPSRSESDDIRRKNELGSVKLSAAKENETGELFVGRGFRVRKNSVCSSFVPSGI